MSNTSILFLVLYFCMWLITVIYKQKNKKRWGASSVFFLSLTVYAALGILYYYKSELNEEITLFPLVYLYIMFRISSYPIELYDRKNVEGIEPPKHNNILTVFTVFYILIAFIQTPAIISNISEGLKTIMLDSMGGSELYSETKSNTETYDGSVTNFLAIIYNFYSPLLFLLLFYYISRSKINFKIVFSLLLCVLIEFLSGIAKGQRTGATMMAMSFVITYFAFKNFLPQKVVRYIRYFSLILGIIILVPFIYITISRFAEAENGISGAIIDYTGHSVVEFDLYAFSANGTRNGDRTCNTFKHLLGISGTPKDMMETRQKYSYMKTDDGSFTTFIGDFVLDFGPFVTFFLFLIFSIIILNATRFRGNYIPFHKMILLYLVMIICMQGGMYLFTFSYKGNLSIIAILLLYLIFRIDYNSKKVIHG